jgi:hypothetical protein
MSQIPTAGPFPTLLDHVVIAGPDLAEVVDRFEQRTGVRAAPGGAHPKCTANALVALTIDGQRGPQYIELIGPDPDRLIRTIPSSFAIDTLVRPGLRTYAVHPPNLEETVAFARQHGYDPGDVADLSRRTPEGELLEWKLTTSDDAGEGFPFLIDWGSTRQPGLSDLPVIELVSFVAVDPEPAHLRGLLQALGLGDGVADVVSPADAPEGTGDGTDSSAEQAGYRLTLRRADGELVTF